MKTAEESYHVVMELRSAIDAALSRCANHPGMDEARYDSISNYKGQVAAATNEAALLLAEAGQAERAELDELSQRFASAVQKSTELAAEYNQADRNWQQAERTINRFGLLPNRVEDRTSVEQSRLKELASLREEAAASNAGQQKLADSLNQARLLKIEAMKAAIASSRARPEPRFDGIVARLREVLNAVAQFENAVVRSVGDYVKNEALSEFTTNTQTFKEAMTYHREQAQWLIVGMFGATVAAMIVAGTMIWYAASIQVQSGAPLVVAIDAIVQHAVGRVAIFVFLLVVVRHLSGFHHANSHQLVIYRDRVAAIAVVEAVIKTAAADRRAALLEAFSDRYLNVERTAFDASGTGSVDPTKATIVELKETLSALQPALETVQRIVGK